jgi:hypothetical protein
MQSNEKEQQNSGEEPRLQKEVELSDAFRALLGMQALEAAPQVDPAAQVQPLSSDPWSSLLHEQGMQAVDLQKIHLHDLHPAGNDDDVEQALNIMREATGQPASQDEKTRET